MVDLQQSQKPAIAGVLAPGRQRVLPDWVLPGVVVAGGVALRLWRLSAPSLWFDEAYSIFVAEQPVSAILARLRSEDVHPPLYYSVLHFWIVAFGTSEASVRFPSVLAGGALVLLTFLLGTRLVNRTVALLAATVVAISPFHLQASRDARMYALLAMFAAAASYALVRACETGQRRYWLLYAACSVLGLYTHYFASTVVLAHGFVVLHRERRYFWHWVVAVVAILLLSAPLGPMVRDQLLHVKAAQQVRPPFTPGVLVDLTALLAFGGHVLGMGTYFTRSGLPLEVKVLPLVPFVLLLVVGGRNVRPRARAVLLAYLAIPVVVAGVVSLWVNIFYERYFSFVLPAYALLLAAGVSRLVFCRRERWVTLGLAAGVAALVLGLSGPALAVTYFGPWYYDWRGAARYVELHAWPEDLLVYIPANAYIPFEYYFFGPQPRIRLNPRELSGRPGGVAHDTVLAERFRALAARYRRMWVVATIPLGYEARLRFARLVTPHFDESDGKAFGRVYVFLWTSREASRAVPERR